MRISGLVCLAVFTGAAVLSSATAYARPNYNKEFWAKYDKEIGSLKQTGCKACHGEDKKVRNDYGKAVGKALGGPKITDVDKIKAAFDEAAKEKSATEGKTFGDLIKDGKLPNP